MKTLLLAICLLPTLSWAISTASEVKNPDGSVTFTDIAHFEGGEKFKIAIDDGKGYASVCKALGFESSLGYGGTGLNTYKTQTGPKLTVNENGSMNPSSSQNYIEKVTCLNSSEHKYIVKNEKQNNEDGSTTYLNLKLLGGDKEFDIAMENSFDFIATCKLLGHKRTILENAGSSRSLNQGKGKVKLSLNGQFMILSDSDTLVSKVTCK